MAENTEAELQRRGRANAARGAWGEQVAADFLCARGWRVVGRNVRPCAKDLRCEIDLVMRNAEGGIVFVEVKTQARR